MDNLAWHAENASQSWSLTEADTHTLRFEMRAGDIWPDQGSARSEIYGQMIPDGTAINLSYSMMIEPGTLYPASTSWAVFGQFHGNYDAWEPSPAWPTVSIQLVGNAGLSGGEHMAVALNYAQQGVNASPVSVGPNGYAWVDPNPIQRGRYYAIHMNVKFDINGNGYVQLYRDGVLLVNYQGPLGYGNGNYWKMGIYRDPASTVTNAVNYKNVELTTVP
jgi:hypothetical protein